ncbi:MAG: c-type cytochrome [Candidatus Eiseniibacteriota bacterium]
MIRPAGVVVLLTAVAASLLAGCGQRPGPGLARGRQVYETCVPCHGANGAGNHALGAPEIAGLPKWYLIAELTKFQHAIRGADPRDREGARMRPMARTLNQEGDVESVAEYVATLPALAPGVALAVGDTAAGSATYTTICVTCHGANAMGNEALGAPPLMHQRDWYMLVQLEKFKTGVRGAHPEDVTGGQMAAMSQTLPDSTAMMNVIAYIRVLQQSH